MNGLTHATTLPLLAATLLSVSGCVTYDVRGTRAQQQREDTLLYEEDVRRLTGRLEGTEMELDRLQMQLDQMEGDQRNFIDQRVRSLEEDVAALDRRIDAVEVSRERDKQEIIDKLSAKMAEIMAARNAAPARTATSQGRRASSDYGYEHVVQPGESLSEIAAAYGTRVNVIVSENNIQDPNRLRVGQKLFIPD